MQICDRLRKLFALSSVGREASEKVREISNRVHTNSGQREREEVESEKRARLQLCRLEEEN